MEIHEGLIQHMYLDSVDKVTVGVGNMLPRLSAAQTLGFVLRNDGSTASTKQVETDWNQVNAEAGKNRRAAYFLKVTQLELPEDICWSMLKQRIDREFLPGLKKIFSNWERFPVPAKRALLDMAYNLGLGGLKKFKTLIEQAKKDNWDQAACECFRLGVSDERNEWTQARFREAISPKGLQ